MVDRLGPAIVTGAGSGIGRATAVALADAGWPVLATDIDAATAEATATAISAAGGTARAAWLDVADPSAWEALLTDVPATEGVPHVLVNNAGIAVAGRFLDHTADDWDRALGVNLLGVIHGCRVVGAAMVAAGRGHIVNLGSMNSFTPAPNLSTYSVTKAGVKMLSECLDAELRPLGVRVSVLLPGMIDTNIVSASTIVTSDDVDEEFADFQRAALGAGFRRGHPPEKVARAVVGTIGGWRTVRPVGSEAWAGWWASRAAPGTYRRAVGSLLSVQRLRQAQRLTTHLAARKTAP